METYDNPLIKIDLLSIEALDRIRACLDLLIKYNYVDSTSKSLRQVYEETIGVYNLERHDPKMWEMIHNHKIESLFQMEQQSGVKGIALSKPESIEELSSLNSIMRLMASDGGKQPLDILAERKKNPKIWDKEMIEYGLNEEERKWLHSWLDASFGICETQETMMSMIQDEQVGGHSLLFADRLRKSVAKKKPEEFLKCREEFFNVIKEKHLSKRLGEYFFDVIVGMSRGYSFCMAHTLAYSIVALQEMNLAYKFPIIFWDTANLIVDSGAMNLEQEFEDNEEEIEEIEDETVEEDKKIKNSSTNFGKVATAVGKMKSRNLKFTLPDINKSDITFTPDIENNTIICGIKGISRIGNQLIKDIFKNRPYSSIEDFLKKVKVNKTQMISLIKAGVFDSLYNCPREEIMKQYINLIADKKKRITLQNMAMLIGKDMIPEHLTFEKRIFNYNKYLKQFKSGDYYLLDSNATRYYLENFNEELLKDLNISGDKMSSKILQKNWDSIYKTTMEPVRIWMKENQEEILSTLNKNLWYEAAEKYTEGSVSKWEMDSLSFYYHEHPMVNLKNYTYGISDFNSIPEEPVVEHSYTTKDGKLINIFKLYRIAGTVIDKNKNKGLITLLTPSGVVIVKVWKSQFNVWDKQISMRNEEGKKKVLEKSWFTRGNMLVITGIKREGSFIPKKYKNTEYPLFEKIEEIDKNGFIVKSTTERIETD